MEKYGVSAPFDEGFKRGLSGKDSLLPSSFETHQDYVSHMEGHAQGSLERAREKDEDKK